MAWRGKAGNVFAKSGAAAAESGRLEERLLKYMRDRYDFLRYAGGRMSYATRRYEFVIEEPDMVTPRTERELSRNLDIVLAAVNCRAYAYRDRMIVNVPRDDREVLRLGGGLEEFMGFKGAAGCYIGERDDGRPAVIDFEEVPHLLVGGTTGSGKSVCLGDIILSAAYRYSPDEAAFYIIDDKNGLGVYGGLPHARECAFRRGDVMAVIAAVREEMARRKELISDAGDIAAYNARKRKNRLPHAFLVIDEADTLLKRGSEAGALADKARLLVDEAAAQGRSLGLHVILASQKPSRANIDTTIKSNIPGRIALQVANSTDSRIILDEKGAEKLSGCGDAILKANSRSLRVQCALTDPDERRKAVKELSGAWS